MLLQLRHLSKAYNHVQAVRDFSLEVEKGELITILGPSGCGKTTTLRMVGGFVAPDSGAIILEGKDIMTLPANLRPTATVFQSYALFPHMNVIKNVMYGLKFKGVGSKEAAKQSHKYLEMVNLDQYWNKPVNQLSGGEQQRVALVRALVVNPQVLLLDEPLSNLDAKLRVKMRRDIKEIQSRLAITTLYVTHDQEEALSISDRVVVMNSGLIEQIGTPQEMYCQPDNLFVADFIGRSNVIPAENGRSRVIRPEHVRILENPGGQKGSIVLKQFNGPQATYFVDTGSTVIQVDVPGQEDRGWTPGEVVFLDLPEQYTIIL